MLLDSNIIIYAAKPEHIGLRELIAEKAPSVSAISQIEVLGYHQLTPTEKQGFETFFSASTVLPVSDAVVGTAIKLRQSRKMSLGDSIVAGTALTYDLTLITRNTKDFKWIADLKLFNPFDDQESQ